MDNGSVATEVYRLLAEDNDCVIHQLGTRGPSGGKHEGRGSWTFARYLADTDYAGKTNAFWDKIKGRLDFQKYCETNGYEGIDYFLIALGTNDVSQGTTLYRTEAEVQKFVDQAKQFIVRCWIRKRASRTARSVSVFVVPARIILISAVPAWVSSK